MSSERYCITSDTIRIPAAHARAAVLLVGLTFCSADAALAAVCEWTGKGANNRWSTAANWELCDGRVPMRGDSIIFRRVSNQYVSENDIAGLTVNAVTFDDPTQEPYDISGVALTVTTAIRMRNVPIPGHGVVLRLPIVMAGALSGVHEIKIDNPGMTLSITGALTGFNAAFATPTRIGVAGRGTLALFNPANDWLDLTIIDATVRLGAAGALPDIRKLFLGGTATLDLNDLNETIGPLIDTSVNDAARIQLGTGTLTIQQTQPANFTGTISGSGGLVKNGNGELRLRRSLAAPGPNTYTGTTTVNEGSLALLHDDNTICIPGPLVITGGTVRLQGDHQIADTAPVTVDAPGRLLLSGFRDTIGSLAGTGQVGLGAGTGTLSIGGDGSSTTFAGTFNAFPQMPGLELLEKIGNGTLTLTGESAVPGIIAIRGGRLIVDGQLNSPAVVVAGGTLGGMGRLVNTSGAGTFNTVTLAPGTIAPGHDIGTLHADAVLFDDGILDVPLRGLGAGDGYSQLDLTTSYRLSPTARLSVTLGVFVPPPGTTFTLINLAGTQLGEGTFAGLPEGGTLLVDGQTLRITYRGGTDANDVVLTAIDDPPALTYFLAEGATGGFFDEGRSVSPPEA